MSAFFFGLDQQSVEPRVKTGIEVAHTAIVAEATNILELVHFHVATRPAAKRLLRTTTPAIKPQDTVRLLYTESARKESMREPYPQTLSGDRDRCRSLRFL